MIPYTQLVYEMLNNPSHVLNERSTWRAYWCCDHRTYHISNPGRQHIFVLSSDAYGFKMPHNCVTFYYFRTPTTELASIPYLSCAYMYGYLLVTKERYLCPPWIKMVVSTCFAGIPGMRATPLENTSSSWIYALSKRWCSIYLIAAVRGWNIGKIPNPIRSLFQDTLPISLERMKTKRLSVDVITILCAYYL